MRTLQSQIRWCYKAQCVLAATTFVVLVSFYVFGYRPQTAKLASLEEEIRRREGEIQAHQSKTSTLPDVMKENVQLQKRLDRIKELPTQQDLPGFLGDLAVLCRQSMLRNVKHQPGAPKRGEKYAELPITLSFEGDFLSVFSFLRNTEELRRLTRMRTLSMRTRDGKAGQVQVQMAMNIYWAE